jgi:hypothetical protein
VVGRGVHLQDPAGSPDRHIPLPPHSVDELAPDQTSELSADYVLQHLAIEREVGDELPKLPLLVLELLQRPHPRRRHAVKLLLPVKVGRLADPRLPADLSDRHPFRTLLQMNVPWASVNIETFIGIAPASQGLTAETLTPNAPVSRVQTTSWSPLCADSVEKLESGSLEPNEDGPSASPERRNFSLACYAGAKKRRSFYFLRRPI